MLSGVVLRLEILRIRPEVELVCGVRIELEERVGVRSVAGGGVGVRVVLRYGLLAGPARRGSPRAGPAEDAKATRGALTECWDHTRWLSSRLACDSPWRRRVRVGSRLELEVSVMVQEQNFAELAGEFARDNFRKRHEAGLRVGRHG
jgi:hypothetical protein